MRNALEVEALVRIEDYIHENAYELAEMAWAGEKVAVYAYRYAPVDGDVEWWITTDGNYDEAGYELVDFFEDAEYEDVVQEYLEDWRAYERDPYAYNGLCEADFH